MRPFLARLFLVFLLAVPVSPAFAQRLKSVPIDNDFVVTPFGPQGMLNRHQTYVMLALHKVVNIEGKTFVCGALYGTLFLNKKFVQQAKIIASDGVTIRTGLTRFSRLSVTNEEIANARRGIVGGPFVSFIRPIKSDVRQFRGQAAKCVRSRKAWRDVFGDGKSLLTMPSRVLVRVPD